MRTIINFLNRLIQSIFGILTSNRLPISGYKLVYKENFSKPIDWNKWDWREPWSGIADTYKNMVFWRKSCVVQKSDGIHLIADTEVLGTAKYDKCGLISSHKHLNILYGYISVVAKVPAGGFLYFPAIWLYDKNGWLPEIDIIELIGFDSTSIRFTHHWLREDSQHKSEGCTLNSRVDYSKEFHNYAVEWTPNRLAWFIDGIEYYSTTNYIPNVPLFLICNIQAGADYEGWAAFTHVFTKDEVPAEMIIKEIKVYQKPG
jgi:beta-glucanase (GH16 family)